MTDHKAESIRIADHINEQWVSEEGQTDTTMIHAGLDALRHATLYAGDQQLIANLIAYATRPGHKIGPAEDAIIRASLGYRETPARALDVDPPLPAEALGAVADGIRSEERERVAKALEDARELGGVYGNDLKRPSNFGRAAEWIRNIK